MGRRGGRVQPTGRYRAQTGLAGGGWPGGTPAPDITALLAVVFVTWAMQFFTTTATVPALLRLTPAVWRSGYLWELASYPLVGFGPASPWILLELLIVLWFGQDVRARLGRRGFWTLLDGRHCGRCGRGRGPARARRGWRRGDPFPVSDHAGPEDVARDPRRGVRDEDREQHHPALLRAADARPLVPVAGDRARVRGVPLQQGPGWVRRDLRRGRRHRADAAGLVRPPAAVAALPIVARAPDRAAARPPGQAPGAAGHPPRRRPRRRPGQLTRRRRAGLRGCRVARRAAPRFGMISARW